MLSSSEIVSLIRKPSRFLTPQNKYIFLLSHMRSRSSLLSHIIGSSPEISGSGELGISYSNWKKGLIKQNIAQKEAKFYFDKILHNGLTKDDKFFSQNFKFVVMLRPAEDTIQSVYNMWLRDGYNSQFIPNATDYLINRLHFIRDKAKLMKGCFFYINSDDLISDTKVVLSELTEFLGLQQELNSTYKLVENTGVAGYGDTSEFIYKGRIFDTRNIQVTRVRFENHDNLLLHINKVWRDCHNELVLNSLNKSC